jgi:hypothetical protein
VPSSVGPVAGGSLIIIVLVCIATAALFAWLAVDHRRFAIGDFRVPRPAIGLLRTSRPAPEGPRPPAPHEPPQPAGERSAAPVGEDVEQRVRDRLYGERNGALRRAPLSND